jgi:hypothetical protein
VVAGGVLRSSLWRPALLCLGLAGRLAAGESQGGLAGWPLLPAGVI